MMKIHEQYFKTKKRISLSFVSSKNKIYEFPVPEDSILILKNGFLCYKEKRSLDNEVGFLYHGYIEKLNE